MRLAENHVVGEAETQHHSTRATFLNVESRRDSKELPQTAQYGALREFCRGKESQICQQREGRP